MPEGLQTAFDPEPLVTILFILACGVAGFVAVKLTVWSDRNRRANSEK